MKQLKKSTIAIIVAVISTVLAGFINNWFNINQIVLNLINYPIKFQAESPNNIKESVPLTKPEPIVIKHDTIPGNRNTIPSNEEAEGAIIQPEEIEPLQTNGAIIVPEDIYPTSGGHIIKLEPIQSK